MIFGTGKGENPPQPPPDCKGVIEVFVVDENSRRPIHGARVWLSGTSRNIQGVTNNQGFVRLEYVPCSRQIIVFASAPGYNDGRHTDRGGSPSQPIELEDNDVVQAVVVLKPKKQSCKGRIVVDVFDNETKQAVANANVWLEGTSTQHFGKTDRHGRVVFDGVACSKNIIAKAIAPGYDEGKHTDPGGHPGHPITLRNNSSEHARVPLKRRVNPPPPNCFGTVKGVVVDKTSGKPIPKAEVTLINTRNARQRIVLNPAITDSKGRFQFDKVPCNVKMIAHAEAQGYNPGTHLDPKGNPKHELEITRKGQVIDDVVVPLEPAKKKGIIEGFVLDRDGNPIGGAEVGLSIDLRRARCISRKRDGYFKIDDAPLNQDLIVWARKGGVMGNHTLIPRGHAGTTPQGYMQCDNLSWNRYEPIFLTAKCNHRINVVVPIVCVGTIRVKVIDKESKQSIHGAVVELVDNSGSIKYQGVTQANGVVEFKNVVCDSSVEYLATASAAGYKPGKHTDDRGSPKHLLKITKPKEIVDAIIALERKESLPPGTGITQTQTQTQTQSQSQQIGDIMIENIINVINESANAGITQTGAKDPCNMIKALGNQILKGELVEKKEPPSNFTFYLRYIEGGWFITDAESIKEIIESMWLILKIFKNCSPEGINKVKEYLIATESLLEEYKKYYNNPRDVANRIIARYNTLADILESIGYKKKNIRKHFENTIDNAIIREPKVQQAKTQFDNALTELKDVHKRILTNLKIARNGLVQICNACLPKEYRKNRKK
ncbi:carboxypeptidase regulatory-like domain-containing protein [Candidatus Woesearchaeota archaeon]|nr:carboxypeptidase regulatory-like domain-containing protein [Candidatus Woesearchaeota archaeon]